MTVKKNPSSFPEGRSSVLLAAFLKPRRYGQFGGRLVKGFKNGRNLLRETMRPIFMLRIESHNTALFFGAFSDQLVTLLLKCVKFLSSATDARHGRYAVLASRNLIRHNSAPQLLKNVAEFTLGGGSSSPSHLHYSKSTFGIFNLPRVNQALSKISALIPLPK